MDKKTENPLDGSRAVDARDSEIANLDTLIDGALGTYTAGEPGRDLSSRILGAAHVLEPSRRAGFHLPPPLPWVFAAAGWLAAAVMLLVWIDGRNLQIVVQPRPAANQLAQSAPPTISPFHTTAPSNLTSRAEQFGSEQSALHMTHFQHTVRTAPHAGRSERAAILQPIAFAPIVMAPIGNGEN